MTVDDLTDRQKRALKGEMSASDWCEMGMDFWKMGVVGIDPLRDADDPSAYRLTEDGVRLARELQAQ